MNPTSVAPGIMANCGYLTPWWYALRTWPLSQALATRTRPWMGAARPARPTTRSRWRLRRRRARATWSPNFGMSHHGVVVSMGEWEPPWVKLRWNHRGTDLEWLNSSYFDTVLRDEKINCPKVAAMTSWNGRLGNHIHQMLGTREIWKMVCVVGVGWIV